MATGFSGLRVEPHGVMPDREVCIWYRNGERLAVIYIDKDAMCIMHEADVRVQVLKRTGLATFEESQ